MVRPELVASAWTRLTHQARSAHRRAAEDDHVAAQRSADGLWDRWRRRRLRVDLDRSAARTARWLGLPLDALKPRGLRRVERALKDGPSSTRMGGVLHPGNDRRCRPRRRRHTSIRLKATRLESSWSRRSQDRISSRRWRRRESNPRTIARTSRDWRLRARVRVVCASRSSRLSTGASRDRRSAASEGEPTPGLEPGTPSLRVKCSTS